MIVVVADESELEGAEQIVGAALRDQAFQAGGVAVFRCHVPESRGGSVEVDALVCTPQSVTIVEVKGFTARQEGTLATPPNGPWTIGGEPAALYHAVRVPNPFVQVRRQVFAAKSLLQQSGIFGWVNAVIALVPQPGAEITIEETRIADGYRAVLVDRDDATALHGYFQAESGRTVRLSIDDVARVFSALNLSQLLPTSDELMAQGFPAVLDPATTSRPAAPTAVELGALSETADSDAPANSASGSTSSSRVGQAATPAFLAAIDRLAHRPHTSARPEESATPARSEAEAESRTPSEQLTDARPGDTHTMDASATQVEPHGEPVPDPESSGTPVAEEDPPSPTAEDSTAERTVGGSSTGGARSPAAPVSNPPDADEPATSGAAAHHEPSESASTGDTSSSGAAPAAQVANEPSTPEVGEQDPSPVDASESAVSLSKSPAGTGSGPVDDPQADGPGDEDEPVKRASSSEHRHEPAPADEDAFIGTRSDAVAGQTVGSGPTVGSAAAVGAAGAIGAAAVVGTAAAAGSGGGTGSWSTPSTTSGTPAVAPPYRPSEPAAPHENPDHWTDWVEHDPTSRRPTPSERWRAWRRGNSPSLIEQWHNRPVRERSASRRWLRIGPGVALLLFIALFGAGFFVITAVQASRFEMSDYDRMCGEDKKPFPNAAPYQRDGARPIYLSGQLTTMVHPDDPTAWNPNDPSTVQLVACMKQLELRDLVQTCQYGPSPGTPVGRTVNLFRATYEIAVYELHTGREVAKATMLGERYSADPSNTDPDRCRAATDAPDYLGRRLGQPSTAQLTGFLAPLVHADR